MGTVIVPRPERCATTAKTSEWERAAPKPRGGGGHPPATLCVQAFSRESLDPPPGTGRGTTSRVLTCDGPNPANLPGAARCCVPFGWVARKHPRGAAPRGAPPARRGSPFLPRNGEKEGRGQAPWTPIFIAARSHSLVFGIVVSGTVEGLLLPVS